MFLLLLVLMTAGVSAQQISEEQARDRALKYLTANGAAKARGMNVTSDTAPPAPSTGTGCLTTCGRG